MACVHPNTVTRNPSGNVRMTPRVQREGFPAGLGPLAPGHWSVPCGRCEECARGRAADLSARAALELAAVDGKASFVTLTFDEAHYPEQGSVAKRDLQLFNKRARQDLGPFRYLGCAEYGGRTARAHYHEILFGIEFPDAIPHPTAKGTVFRHPALEKLWPFGFSTVSRVEPAHINYVAGYLTKKISGLASPRALVRFDRDTGESELRHPMFHAMSTGNGGFGLGAAIEDELLDEIMRTGSVRVLERPWRGDGPPPPGFETRSLLPGSLMAKLAERCPEAYIEMAAQRAALGSLSRIESPPEFRKARREALAAEREKLKGKPDPRIAAAFPESRDLFVADFDLVDRGVFAADELLEGKVNRWNPVFQVAGLSEASAERIESREEPGRRKSLPAHPYARFGVLRPEKPTPTPRPKLSADETERRQFARECVTKLRDVHRTELNLAVRFRDLVDKGPVPLREALSQAVFSSEIHSRRGLRRSFLPGHSAEALNAMGWDDLKAEALRLRDRHEARASQIALARDQWRAVARGLDAGSISALPQIFPGSLHDLEEVRAERRAFREERKRIRVISICDQSGEAAATWALLHEGRTRLPELSDAPGRPAMSPSELLEHLASVTRLNPEGQRVFSDSIREANYLEARSEGRLSLQRQRYLSSAVPALSASH